MVNYQNGKIYNMLMPDGYFYIGCTCNELRVRKQMHKNACGYGVKQTQLYKHIRKSMFEWTDIHMVLFEMYPCKERSELLLRESQIIRQFYLDEFCLNTNKFTNIDNSTYENLYIKQLQKYKNERINHGEEVRDNDRKRYELKRKFVRLEKIVCICGVTHCRTHIRKHERTAKHLKWISENPQ